MQKKYIPFTLLFVILLVILAHFGARMTAAVPVFSFAEAEEERVVYLTFDDGPSTKVTNAVLDVLEKEDVKATFFVVSDRTAGREEVLRRIVREGHTVGVHSKSHEYNKIYASDESLLRDVEACAKVIYDLTGVTPRVYRFPGGGTSRREHHTQLLRSKGYRVVSWNAVCFLMFTASSVVRPSAVTKISRAQARTSYFRRRSRRRKGKNPSFCCVTIPRPTALPPRRCLA